MKQYKSLCFAVCVLVLSGCSTLGEQNENDANNVNNGQTQTGQTTTPQDVNTVTPNRNPRGGQTTTSGLGSNGETQMNELPKESLPPSERMIYFDFDQSLIRADMQNILGKHAEYLAENPRHKVLLEGHADERGTREYNMALGERRTKAVKQVLVLQGAYADQIDMVSYGEEKPVSMGHDEESWALNRRVEFIYQSK